MVPVRVFYRVRHIGALPGLHWVGYQIIPLQRQQMLGPGGTRSRCRPESGIYWSIINALEFVMGVLGNDRDGTVGLGDGSARSRIPAILS
jgi:hypothetical protein